MEKFGNVLSWASNLDDKARAQAALSSQLPVIDGHIALMPDAHWGMGATIGSVIPTRGAIIPAAVGVDIGCGMIAAQTTLQREDLPDNLGLLHGAIREVIPAGVGQGHTLRGTTNFILSNGSVSDLGLRDKAARQMGTLGSGNHFVELCTDAGGQVWIVLHSGSRGVGNQLARKHITEAKGVMKRYFIDLDDKDLSYFVEGTDEFKHYMTDLDWAQKYAFLNRQTMLASVLQAVRGTIGRGYTVTEEINCHHNYTALENHHGKDLYITRKGAIRARSGDRGVIPGSMGTNSFIVTGKGNPASYTSAAHGAGRAMSRKAARERYTQQDLADTMEGKTWNSHGAKDLVDEIPMAYKNIHTVMEDQADLVEVTHELTQFLNYKGT